MYFSALAQDPFQDTPQLTGFAPAEQAAQATAAQLPDVDAVDYASMVRPFGRAPQMQGINVNATGIGDGLAQGISQGITGGLNMRAQQQWQDDYRNARAAELRYKAMQDAAAQEAEYNKLHAYDQYLTPEQQALNTASGGNYVNTTGTGQANIGLTLPKAQAEAEAAEKTADTRGRAGMREKVGALEVMRANVPKIEVGGIPQPQAVNDYTYLSGGAPVTSVDIQSDILDRDNKAQRNAKAGVELQYQQPMAQQGLVSATAKAEIDTAKATFAALEEEIRVRGLESKQFDETAAREKLDEAKPLYMDALQRWDSMTPAMVKRFNAEMGAEGLDELMLPEKETPEYQFFASKGKVKSVGDKRTGQLYDPGEVPQATPPRPTQSAPQVSVTAPRVQAPQPQQSSPKPAAKPKEAFGANLPKALPRITSEQEPGLTIDETSRLKKLIDRSLQGKKRDAYGLKENPFSGLGAYDKKVIQNLLQKRETALKAN